MTETVLNKIDQAVLEIGQDMGTVQKALSERLVLTAFRDRYLNKIIINNPVSPTVSNNAVIETSRIIHPNLQTKQTIGMDASTGKAITGIAHLHQSFICLLTTDLKTRVKRRDFGFDQSYLDRPSKPHFILKIYAEIAELFDRYEPRFKLKKIAVKLGESVGQFIFIFHGLYQDTEQKIEVQI